MMKALLADRFKVTIHIDTREVPAYDLVLASSDGKLGSQLRPSDIDCGAAVAFPDLPAPCRRNPSSILRDVGMFQIDGLVTMERLAEQVRKFVGRVVVDKTGLKGTYNVLLKAALGPNAASSGELSFVSTAIQDQLGLKLVPSRTTVDVVVIDHIEQPTPN
jgi:uncharacterized protein (TIGR03435 family)